MKKQLKSKLSFIFYLFVLAGLSGSCTQDQKSTDQTQEEASTTRTTKDLPNIVLLVSDDHGSTDLGCYGNEAISTPNLDQLASEGVRFTSAFCTTASCSASRSVILTGLYNHANGQYGHQHGYNHFSAFDNVRSLPVMLGEHAGYETARIGKFHVAPEEVFKFEHVLDDAGRNVVKMADNCLPFIRENKDKPFFLYFCTHDPHRSGDVVEDHPHQPNRFGNKDAGFEGVEEYSITPEDVEVPFYLPDNEATRAELVQYYESVQRMDQGFGRLFQHLKDEGVWDNTIVMYISDNGIAFPGAKTTLYDPGMRLPCIVRNPLIDRKNDVETAKVNWADLTPTILDFAGIYEKLDGENASFGEGVDNDMGEFDSFHGRSFKSVLETGNNEGWDETYASHTFHEITMYYPMRVVISGDYKLIWNIAHGLSYPFATDLWASATWQYIMNNNKKMYANRSVNDYLHRSQFELYNLKDDPGETNNLANSPSHQELLTNLKSKLKDFQSRTYDPWSRKWKHE